VKTVLDVCCASRSFWFDKNDEQTVYVDIRSETIVRENMTRKDGSLWRGWTMEINPNILASFTTLPFQSNYFSLVVFDPPHAEFGGGSYMAKQYGTLRGRDWHVMISGGFSECVRVLKQDGILIFKWNEQDIPVSEILKLCPIMPLFGHKSGKLNKTHWLTFQKRHLTQRPPDEKPVSVINQ